MFLTVPRWTHCTKLRLAPTSRKIVRGFEPQYYLPRTRPYHTGPHLTGTDHTGPHLAAVIHYKGVKLYNVCSVPYHTIAIPNQTPPYLTAPCHSDTLLRYDSFIMWVLFQGHLDMELKHRLYQLVPCIHDSAPSNA